MLRDFAFLLPLVTFAEDRLAQKEQPGTFGAFTRILLKESKGEIDIYSYFIEPLDQLHHSLPFHLRLPVKLITF